MIINPKIKPRVLMCRPTYYEVSYDINAHMARTLKSGRKVDLQLAQKQWDGLYNFFDQNGADIQLIEPVKGLPDMVFTANAGLISDDKTIVVLSNFRYAQRKGETEYFEKWFSQEDYGTVQLPSWTHEGHGDALRWKDKLICGYGFRSDKESILTAAGFIGYEPEKENIALLELVNPDFYHLDTCFAPLGEHALFYPEAFSKVARKELESFEGAIVVSEEDARCFVCNGVYIEGKSGPTFIVNALSEGLKKAIEKIGIRVVINETSEFQLSGGSNRCLTLFV